MKLITHLSCCAALAAFCLSPTAFAADIIGINAAVKGSTTIETDGEVRKAVVSDKIRLQDAVNTSKSSSLQILLQDQTTFTVGPNCDLVIDKFVYDPSKNDNTLQATVTKGMFRFMSGSISKSNPDDVSINTPVASMGIRGTIVEGVVGAEAVKIINAMNIISPGIKVDPAGASLFVLRGPGEARFGNDNIGKITVSNKGGSVSTAKVGQAVFVANADTAPILIDAIDEDSFAFFSRQLRTIPNGGPDTMAFNVSPNIPAGLTTGAGVSGTGVSGASASGAVSGKAIGAGLSKAGGAAAGGLNLGVIGAVLGGSALAVIAASGGGEDNERNDTAVSN